MINVESDVFNLVALRLREAYPDAFVTSEYVKTPPTLPCVSLVEIDNAVYQRTRTNTTIENHALLTLELNVYSNKANGKKAECREIAAIVDTELALCGFTRTMLNPIPNMEDATIYRLTGRYQAVVSKEKIVYRR